MFKKKAKTPEVKKPEKAKKAGNDKKWLLWGLLGFTGILVVTAVILFLQLKKPASTPTPKPRPKASPVVPPVKQVTGEGVCEVAFSLEEEEDLVCTSITMDPNDTTVEESDERELTAIVTGGATPYTHSWTISSTGSNGTLSSTTTNPTDWTAPGTLSADQTWTITDTITDSSTTPQTTTCSVSLSYSEEDELACFDSGCTSDDDCDGSLRCQDVAGVDRCVNAECPNDIDCICPGTSPSPSPSSPPKGAPDPSPVPSPRVEDPALPEAGVSAPAVLGVSAGLLLVIFGLLF